MTEPNPVYVPAPVQQAYQAAPKRPPLSRELKRAASVAGGVSFTVMSIGWGLLSAAVGIGLFAGFFVGILTLIGSSSTGRDADYFQMMDIIETINPGAWIIPLVLAGVVGIGLWVWSLFISRGMLARAQHPSPWGVTWAGAGIAIAASWLLSWVAWLPMQLVGFIVPGAYTSFENGLAITIVFAVVSLVLNLAFSVTIGWLSWWWMAHAMRPAVRPQ